MDGRKDARPCAFCRRHPVVADWRPFCSHRCQLQDLARWADGSYRVSGDAAELPDHNSIEDDTDDASGNERRRD
jgi:endogenous inhibitor of DNA gyrase (YacG/DUF329 family)